MSWKPEVIVESGGKWTGNALRFATEQEAKDYAFELAMRWTGVRDWRVVEDTARVNYAIVDGKLTHLKVDRQEEGFI